MPSLKLGNFSQYLTAGESIDYIEVRQGEAYVLPFTVSDNQTIPQPIDLTDWILTTELSSYTAKFQYQANNELSAVSDFTEQGSQPTVAGLVAQVTDAVLGQGVLTIPTQVTTLPAGNVTADGDNTLLNVVTITASYPTSVSGFSAVRKLMIGLIVRIS
jgi:hypothetical protein